MVEMYRKDSTLSAFITSLPSPAARILLDRAAKAEPLLLEIVDIAHMVQIQPLWVLAPSLPFHRYTPSQCSVKQTPPPLSLDTLLVLILFKASLPGSIYVMPLLKRPSALRQKAQWMLPYPWLP